MLLALGSLSAQSDDITLKVVSIKEDSNMVVEIKAVNSNLDTLRILSKKNDADVKDFYEKMKEGESYHFELKSNPSYIDNYVVRISGKVYWRTGDPFSEMPYFANNVMGFFIRRE